MAFVPKKRTRQDIENIKNLFLSGKTIRKNGMGKFELGNSNSIGNIGRGESLSIDEQDFWTAVNELKQEGYVMKKWGDSYSGCCQYYVWCFRLKGENE